MYDCQILSYPAALSVVDALCSLQFRECRLTSVCFPLILVGKGPRICLVYFSKLYLSQNAEMGSPYSAVNVETSLLLEKLRIT